MFLNLTDRDTPPVYDSRMLGQSRMSRISLKLVTVAIKLHFDKERSFNKRTLKMIAQ